MSLRHRTAAGLLVCAAIASMTTSAVSAPTGPDPVTLGKRLDAIASSAMAGGRLRAVILRVTSNGGVVYQKAFGESMSGVPATPDMHFRAGAMGFTYMSTLLLILVDKGVVSLDDPLSKWFPNLPHAREIKLRNLANMTSGYADYVYRDEVLRGVTRDPFRRWSSDELIRIGTTKPMMFAPGTNWGYSHTNYVILGRVLEMLTHTDLNSALKQNVYDKMGLTETRDPGTPAIPEPVLHGFSSERREDLGIARGTRFYEESTFWNPSWTTARGAVETTDVADLTGTMEAVGEGKLLSRDSSRAQIEPRLAGFGHKDPKCPVCAPLSVERSYGLGVVLYGPWITQTKDFAGSAASVGYMPSGKIAIAVVTNFGEAGYDKDGSHADASVQIFNRIANLVAPGSISPPKP